MNLIVHLGVLKLLAMSLSSWFNLARRALLIGNGTFDLEVFSNLQTPANNARDLSDVLKEYGHFEIFKIVVDETWENIKKVIHDFFHQAERGDLSLLYYTGHGVRDEQENYYLLARNSQPDNLELSGIDESFIHKVMKKSRAKHFITILDCCYSGAFSEGRMSGAETLLPQKLKGRANVVLASSTKVQPSFEEKDAQNSLFTQYLIQGMKTGLDGKSQDTHILIDDLFYYTEQKVKEIRPTQTPVMKLQVCEDEIFITTHPKSDSYPQRPSILSVFCSEFPKSKGRAALNELLRPYTLLNQPMFAKKTKPVTLENIIERLEHGRGRFNIVHVQVSGIISSDNEDKPFPRLLISASAGSPSQLITADELERYFHQIPAEFLPHLLILDIYPKDEYKENSLFANFRAVIVNTGVPAVLTVCNSKPFGETTPFHEAFYHELSENGSGQIAKAVAKGRQALCEAWGVNSLTAESSAWLLPVLHLAENVQVQFETHFEHITVLGLNGKKWALPPKSQLWEGEAEGYKEDRMTEPPLKIDISEYLLNVVNVPPSRNNFLFVHANPRYGKTKTLLKLLHKQLQHLEARTLDMIPIYIAIDAPINAEKLSNVTSADAWKSFIDQEIRKFYIIPLPDSPETFLVDQFRLIVLLDNVHELPEPSIAALHQFIRNAEQFKHFFVLTCPSRTRGNFTRFGLEGNTLELKEFPPDAISKHPNLDILKDYAPLKEMALCPEIFFDFEELIGNLQGRKTYPYATLLENWIHRQLGEFKGPVDIEQILSAMEKLASSMLGAPNRGVSRRRAEESLKETLEINADDAKTLFNKLLKHDNIRPREDNPHFYEFPYSIVQAFLSARILAREVKQTLEKDDPLSFFKQCCSEDETQHRMLEFLIELLRDHQEVQVVCEQIVIDALRTDNLTILANVINPRRFNYPLTRQVEKFAFISLLEQFAIGNNVELFIELMKHQKITVNIKTNWTIKCHHHIIEKVKELLNSEDDDEFRVAVSTLPWIVSDQSVPLAVDRKLFTKSLFVTKISYL